MQRTKHYSSNEEIIQGKTFGPRSTNEEISLYVKNKFPLPGNENVHRQVINQIKKKTVVEQLYKGKCVACEKITIKNNLPAIDFHHREKNDDKSKVWNKINHLEIMEIIKELINKNCVSVCGNCHQMIKASQFKNINEEILHPKHWNKLKKCYQKIEKNIEDFKFKEE